MKVTSAKYFAIFRNTQKKHIFYAIVIVLMFGFFKVSILGGWDESFYWAQLTSIWYDGDLTLHDDLLANYNPISNQYRTITTIKYGGELFNDFPIGIALVDGLYAGPLVALFKLLGLPRMNGFFLSVVAIATICKIWLLLFALKHFLDKYDKRPSWKYIIALGSFLGLPIFYYSFYAYGMAHLNSGLFATLFVSALISWLTRPERQQSLLLGLSAGLMILTRWQNAIFVLLVIPPLLYQLSSSSKNERMKFLKGCGVVLALIAVMSALQFTVFYKQLGNVFLMPQGGNFMKWSSPQWMAVLLSGYHGLIPWSPLLLIAVVGLLKAMFWQRGLWRWFMIGAILTITATVYVNASVVDWWAGWAYGARRFCCLIPLVALGAFEVVRSLRKRLAILLLTGVMLWSYFTYTCYKNQIDDLAVPLLGRVSQQCPDAAALYWIHSPEDAWEKLKRKLPAPRYSAVKLLRFVTLPNFVNQLASAIILILIFCGTKRLFLFCEHNSRFTRWSALCFLGYTVMLTAVIILRFPNSYQLNLPWRAYLHTQITAEEAIRQELPLEPVYFIKALSQASQQQLENARSALVPIDTRSYRYITFEKIVELSHSMADK